MIKVKWISEYDTYRYYVEQYELAVLETELYNSVHNTNIPINLHYASMANSELEKINYCKNYCREEAKIKENIKE